MLSKKYGKQGSGLRTGKNHNRTAKMISTAVAKALAEIDTVAKPDTKDDDDARSYIMSLFGEEKLSTTQNTADVSSSSTTPTTPTIKLTTILKRAKRQFK